MRDHKEFASLSPSLLARKGAARPAMRPQVQPLHEFQEAASRPAEDDLGWNDMGHDTERHGAEQHGAEQGAEVVPLDESQRARAAKDGLPEVVRQREAIVERFARPAGSRRSALAEGRRAAFTLRLDADRHLRLRLASTVLNQSAQAIVTAALEQYLAEMPEITTLAGKIRKRG
ncbi:hypothetical protein [Novosphingobium album (ex Liu et al. 2023)]|uniref:CopG family transcriptional regulator n=1 Tax=Novosphingobium album (ex Liu et al. 2023) TaxID=3031130 RepID=A0ABT5WRK7_9SPHN|nr:hypothetical protein [Novosphingobium album (ex Liu et al. 2023)]MDE8652673.1 hypothetical protein [Novosphingobium album (ex Liu et al. 2023)]